MIGLLASRSSSAKNVCWDPELSTLCSSDFLASAACVRIISLVYKVFIALKALPFPGSGTILCFVPAFGMLD